MKNRFILGIFLLLAAPCQALENNADGERTISCRYNQKKPMTSGEAKLGIKDGKINRIGFNNYYPGGLGELGYTCNIGWSRNDQAYTWVDNGSGLIITAKESGESVQLSRSKKGYSLNFANLKSQSKFCGDGALLPNNLFIPLSGKACTVSIPR